MATSGPERGESSSLTERLLGMGVRLTSELDLTRLHQLISDEAARLCGAEYSAFTTTGGEQAATGARADRFESVLSAAVVSRSGEPLGDIALGDQRPDAFTDDHRRALACFAELSAVALDNARLLMRVRAAEADAEREGARLRTLFMEAPMAVAVWRGPRHVYEVANALYRDMTGDRELLGRAIRDCFPETPAAPFFAVLDQVFATGEPYTHLEFPARYDRRRTGGAEDAFLAVHVVPIQEAGATSGLMATVVDVTDQVRARRRVEALATQLEQSERRYRSLAQATSQTIWTANPDGEMIGEQPGWAALTAQSYQQYQGYGWADAVHPDDRSETIRLWQQAITSRRVFVCEHRVRSKGGDWRHFSVRAVPVIEGGLTLEWACVHSDVTERKQAEDERERLITALERSNQALDQFAYVASHDLKAPLRGIGNLSDWLEEDLGASLNAAAREHLRLLRGRVGRMDALIDGILRYSRAGRVREHSERIEVGPLLGEVVELLSPPPDLSIEIGPGMPVIEGERVPLQQVFLNLIGNACKHGARPGGTVIVAVQDRGAFHHFTVTDDGPGIAPEFHERIWGIFQTLQARDKVEGAGIGLAVVKRIVESVGGRVSLDSAEGQGATFHVMWPKQIRHGASAAP